MSTIPRPNRLKQALAEGRVPVGHMVWEFSTRGISKLIEAAGVDFCIFDMEHSCIDVERIADLLAWVKATPVTPFVRLPQNEYHFLARVMDAGAMGVMVANVETPEAARNVVAAVKYAPMGRRGVGIGTSHTDYLNPDPETYFREINEASTIICQIESVFGVQNAEAIAATPGVDILWVGHFDLSQTMGIPGQFHDKRFTAALLHVVEAARKHGKLLGIQPGSMEQAEEWMGYGFNVISYSADSAVYKAALSAGVAGIRELAKRAR